MTLRSVYSFSLQSRAPVSHALTALSPPEKMLHSRSSSSSSTFSIQQQASTSSHHQTAAGSSSGSPQLFRSSVISVSSMQSSAMKLLGNINISSIGDSKPSTGTHSHHSDEGDIKVVPRVKIINIINLYLNCLDSNLPLDFK